MYFEDLHDCLTPKSLAFDAPPFSLCNTCILLSNSSISLNFLRLSLSSEPSSIINNSNAGKV